MILGFTGTQSGLNKFQKEEFIKFLNEWKPNEFHHGDCIGADAEAHFIFIKWHMENNKENNNDEIRSIVIHPPLNGSKRAFTFLTTQKMLDKLKGISIEQKEPLGYHARNQEIVKASDKMIACPKELEHTLRSGTWTTIRFAWHTKKEIYVIPPLKEENHVETDEKADTH